PAMDGADLLRQAEEALARARARGDAIVTAAGGKLTPIRRRTPPPRARRHAIPTALRLGLPYLADPAHAAVATAVSLLSAETAGPGAHGGRHRRGPARDRSGPLRAARPARRRPRPAAAPGQA